MAKAKPRKPGRHALPTEQAQTAMIQECLRQHKSLVDEHERHQQFSERFQAKTTANAESTGAARHEME